MSKAHFRTLELPGDSGHDVHGICSAHSDADGAEATAVGCVGVRANQHHPGVGVVLQNDLSTEGRDVHSQSLTHSSLGTSDLFQLPF